MALDTPPCPNTATGCYEAAAFQTDSQIHKTHDEQTMAVHYPASKVTLQSNVPTRKTHDRLVLRKLNTNNEKIKILKLIERASEANENEDYSKAALILENEIFPNLVKAPQAAKQVSYLADKEAVIAYGNSRSELQALIHFDRYLQGTADPDPNIILQGMMAYMGAKPWASVTDICAAPTFNPEKLKTVLFKSLPSEPKYQWKMWAQSDTYAELFISAIQAIRSNHQWDVSTAIDQLEANDEYRLFSDIIHLIAAQKHIEKKRYILARETAERISSDSPPYLRNHFVALSCVKEKRYEDAIEIYTCCLITGEPVFKEFERLLSSQGREIDAAFVCLMAASYYLKHEYLHEVAFYRAQADTHYINICKKIDDLKEKKKSHDSSEYGEEIIEEEPVEDDMDKTEGFIAQFVPIAFHEEAREETPKTMYFKIQAMIKEDSAHQNIKETIQAALQQYPNDLWLLHSAGWWYHTQGNSSEAKRYLLRGLKCTLNIKRSFKNKLEADKERKQLHTIDDLLRQRYANGIPHKTASDICQCRDIASFLSAFAHLVSQHHPKEANTLRRWADRLDTRRILKALSKYHYGNDAGVQLIKQERFDSIRQAMLE